LIERKYTNISQLTGMTTQPLVRQKHLKSSNVQSFG